MWIVLVCINQRGLGITLSNLTLTRMDVLRIVKLKLKYLFFFTVKFLSISDHLKKKTDFSCKESQKKNGLKCVETIKGRLPHVDQILGERHSIGSTRNCDGSVRRAALPVVAI